jgi:EAL domain-containing protein (putative c-di-GMP-specific phosphodiesterase class I)
MDAGMAPMVVGVNLSAVQFRHAGLPDVVSRALADAGLPAQYLELELTESVTANPAAAISMMDALHALGVRLSLDDFGTGYSSLSYLSKFPVDILKMDRSFLEAESDADSGLAAAVVALGATLNMEVVAEGIELTTQMTSLRELGCELGQGFLFARPMSFDSIVNYLDDARGGASVLRLPPLEPPLEPQSDAA